jgi:hypothetical protein
MLQEHFSTTLDLIRGGLGTNVVLKGMAEIENFTRGSG